MADVFDLAELLRAHAAGGQLYYEFLQRATLSVGVYHLPPDQADPQRPHTEDEIYSVIAGTGRVQIGETVREIQPGSVIFVGRDVPHRFFDFPAGLTLLVIFAPPRGSGRPAAG